MQELIFSNPTFNTFNSASENNGLLFLPRFFFFFFFFFLFFFFGFGFLLFFFRCCFSFLIILRTVSALWFIVTFQNQSYNNSKCCLYFSACLPETSSCKACQNENIHRRCCWKFYPAMSLHWLNNGSYRNVNIFTYHNSYHNFLTHSRPNLMIVKKL